ncbi:MarR family transcriptional regulator [Erythrobacter sp. 3-20A1M]|uniref:GbsR/MarR family transcriptional regulator n=1 Tax=Erythrobacter sp. 3-20A1M TaxID=2653850 RepID=UPI001BFC0C89|nr:MarR family transcriptional regulator [Erythrobacter sp. 3-20A1M]QWC56354.1 MarR family transcriptional regulator [Erythrobacter sp. 3-20A1M]
MTTRKITLSEAETDFIERRGISAESDGQARITGRIWALLMVVARDLTSTEIADTLMVSRGSVSTNLRLLEGLKIIERRSKPGERETYFGMSEHPYTLLIKQLIERFAGYRRMIEAASSRMERPECRENVASLAKFYELQERGHRYMLAELERFEK